MFKLTFRNIFLLDGIGAIVSVLLMAGVLPLLSEHFGLTVQMLYSLAIPPAVFSVYSLSCFWLVKQLKPWMLMAIIIANLAYCLLTGHIVATNPELTLLGYFYLVIEIIVIISLVAIEFQIFRSLRSLSKFDK